MASDHCLGFSIVPNSCLARAGIEGCNFPADSCLTCWKAVSGSGIHTHPPVASQCFLPMVSVRQLMGALNMWSFPCLLQHFQHLPDWQHWQETHQEANGVNSTPRSCFSVFQAGISREVVASYLILGNGIPWGHFMSLTTLTGNNREPQVAAHDWKGSRKWFEVL